MLLGLNLDGLMARWWVASALSILSSLLTAGLLAAGLSNDCIAGPSQKENCIRIALPPLFDIPDHLVRSLVLRDPFTALLPILHIYSAESLSSVDILQNCLPSRQHFIRPLKSGYTTAYSTLHSTSAEN